MKNELHDVRPCRSSSSLHTIPHITPPSIPPYSYHAQGLSILAFPCNQFAWQEPGSDDAIKKRICEKFKVDFDLMAKVDVNGSDADPFYNWLVDNDPTNPGKPISWNFSKFLVSRDGRVVGRWTGSPKEMRPAIEQELAKPAVVPTGAGVG